MKIYENKNQQKKVGVCSCFPVRMLFSIDAHVASLNLF